jgi:hypothetical protein
MAYFQPFTHCAECDCVTDKLKKTVALPIFRCALDIVIDTPWDRAHFWQHTVMLPFLFVLNQPSLWRGAKPQPSALLQGAEPAALPPTKE